MNPTTSLPGWLNATDYCCIKLSAGFICTHGNLSVPRSPFSVPRYIPRCDCSLLPVLNFPVPQSSVFHSSLHRLRTTFLDGLPLSHNYLSQRSRAHISKDIWAAGTCNTGLIHILLSPSFCCRRKLIVYSFALFEIKSVKPLTFTAVGR